MDPVIRSGPAPALTSEQKDLRQRRTRLLTLTALVVTLAAAGGGVYYYTASAPQRAETQFRAGMSMMTPGNYHLAVQHFNRALEISPDMTQVYAQRGVAYQNQGQIEAAMQDFDRALAANPKDSVVLTARGVVYRDRNDLNKAIDEFSRVIDVRGDTDAYYERAQAYEAIGDHTKALADFDKVIQDLQNAPHALRARALVKKKMGDEDGFKADVEAAVAQELRNVKNSLK
jgi:tetratricopeptide (TPR) repeat protein